MEGIQRHRAFRALAQVRFGSKSPALARRASVPPSPGRRSQSASRPGTRSGVRGRARRGRALRLWALERGDSHAAGRTRERAAGPSAAMAEPAAPRCCLGWDFSTQQVLSRPRVRAGRGRRLRATGRASGALGAGTPGPSPGRTSLGLLGDPAPLPDEALPVPPTRKMRQRSACARPTRKRRPPPTLSPRQDPGGTWQGSAQRGLGTGHGLPGRPAE